MIPLFVYSDDADKARVIRTIRDEAPFLLASLSEEIKPERSLRAKVLGGAGGAPIAYVERHHTPHDLVGKPTSSGLSWGLLAQAHTGILAFDHEALCKPEILSAAEGLVSGDPIPVGPLRISVATVFCILAPAGAVGGAPWYEALLKRGGGYTVLRPSTGEMFNICPRCQGKTAGDTSFCAHCGKRLVAVQA